MRFAEIMPDEESKFLSGVNAGILYLNNGMVEKAEEAFKTGLRSGVLMDNEQAQSIAICYQGLANVAKGDWLTAQSCMER